MNKRGVKYTKDNEGYRDHIYKCSAGKLTVGWGTHLEEGSLVPKEVSQILFRQKYQNAEHEFEKLNLSLNPARRIVIVDMIYNLGLPRFLGFKKMLQALKMRDFDWAADELEDSKYFKQVGLRGIHNRDILRSGIFE